MSTNVPIPEPPPRSGWACCLWGCLGMFLVGMLLCGVGGILTYFYGKPLIADAARNALVAVIEESEIDQGDKEEMIAQIDRVVQGFKQGDVTYEDMGKIVTELAESPVMAVLIVFSIQEKYIKPSGLTADEKAAGRVTLERVARGMIEKQLSQPDLQNALDEVSTVGADGKRKLKDRVTDDELRTFLAKAEQAADKAGVSHEPLEVDLGGELKKVVDKALGTADEDPPIIKPPKVE